MIARKPALVVCPCGSFHHGLPGLPRTALTTPYYSRQQMPRQHTPSSHETATHSRTFASAMHDDALRKASCSGWGRDAGHHVQPHGNHSRHSHLGHPENKSRFSDYSDIGGGNHCVRPGRSRQIHIMPWPKTKDPTPYEIFNLDKGEEYSKARFYELVKQYHPDRRHHTPDHLIGVPQNMKLERYRLVIAANNILSDPTKRRAYDLYGFGWAAAEDVDIQTRYRNVDRNWRQRAGNPAMNATWEDWERWHYEQAGGGKQEPQYMSNRGFVLLVVVCAILGGWGQVTRLDSNTVNLVEMREEHHNTIKDTLVQQQIENAQLSREERVGSFLERREGWGYTLPTTPRGNRTASYDSEDSDN